jgi:hypothetical protein
MESRAQGLRALQSSVVVSQHEVAASQRAVVVLQSGVAKGSALSETDA